MSPRPLSRIAAVVNPQPRTAVTMITLSYMGALLTGLLAQVKLPMPGTPVPFTGQVFAVLVCGALLGGGYGALSQIIYLALGAAGMPWFAGWTAGYGVLAGATGGYLVGFVIAAFLLGRLTERFEWAKTLNGQLALMLAAVGVIYACGALHLALVLGKGIGTAFLWGVAPFVGFDVAKAAGAAWLTASIYNRD